MVELGRMHLTSLRYIVQHPSRVRLLGFVTFFLLALLLLEQKSQAPGPALMQDAWLPSEANPRACLDHIGITDARSVTFFQRNAHLVQDVRYHCLASLVFMAWDTLLTFGNEVEYVWRVPWKSKIKWLYLYFRYVPLIVHIAFEFAIFDLTSGYAAPSTCKAWLMLIWIILQLSSSLFEYILALCTYALFNRSRYIAFLFSILIAGEIVSAAFTAKELFAETAFETVCILVYLPRRNMMYACFVLATHATLASLVVSKSLLAARAGRGRTPLVSLLIKQGVAYYGILIVYFSVSFVSIVQADNRAISLFMSRFFLPFCFRDWFPLTFVSLAGGLLR
ncbi:hypothetical protein F5I97DRAFT_1881321 [Phlebopus sp. FC_14]|nr:hypothetical protein F5I97DRAFT_1881321 [Phlebopus sp. FC_14]